ncbi:MAG TPA: permease [Kaistiaceae bacterium]|nr:permease [Kaistiaceae bacterium]
MNMTHYMELLAVNQPWNLLAFMAIPVILAETVAITELWLLYYRNYEGPVRTVNRAASILGGIYFTGVFVYLLFNAVMPLTMGGEWRGPADVIAVLSYLAGVVPLAGIALIDLGVIARDRDAHGKMGLHAAFVALFLVVAHVAMIFGMMDPTILGAAPAGHMTH